MRDCTICVAKTKALICVLFSQMQIVGFLMRQLMYHCHGHFACMFMIVSTEIRDG